VAGLAVLGLDLGEYVKFLPEVRAGARDLWREGFYLPLVAVSLTLSLCTWRAELRWPPARGRAGHAGADEGLQPPRTRRAGYAGTAVRWMLIALQVIGAIAAALNLLPPAWTPGRMLTPEFQQQAAALALCLAAVASGPFLALLPRRVTGVFVLLLCLPASVVPVQQFLAVLPEIATLYNHPLTPGWSMVVMLAGLLLLLALGGLLTFAGLRQHTPQS
jgi:hypothetical protein